MSKRRYRTVVPLANLDFEIKEPFQFASDATIERVPTDLREETDLKELGRFHKEWIAGCRNCLIIHYEADAPYSPDPNWKGDPPRTIEQSNREAAYLANLAFWLQHPSPIGFRWLFHMPEFDGKFIVQSSEDRNDFLCHPYDKDERVRVEDLEPAKALFAALLKIPHDTPVWTPLRSIIAALQMNVEEIRYLLLWTALEALFGAPIEIKFRISQRIAFFITGDKNEARAVFGAIKKSYDFRSKVAHGAWKKNKDSTDLTANTEQHLRRSLVRMLLDDNLMTNFLGKDETRNDYLEELIFLYGTPPRSGRLRRL
jgi:hypothetical protein